MSDVDVLRQELKNISNQLAMMQSTMMMWMDVQNRQTAEQQKKTSNWPTISANSPYAWHSWRRD